MVIRNSNVNRVLINSVKEELHEFKQNIDSRFNKIDNDLKDLFNHQSTRLPNWATAIIAILSSIVSGFLVRLF